MWLRYTEEIIFVLTVVDADFAKERARNRLSNDFSYNKGYAQWGKRTQKAIKPLW